MTKQDGSFYDKDYYERGLETGKSFYQNYRWLPELTMAMAMIMIDYLKIKPGQKIIELGCAKGFLVKALNLLHRQTWGIDISPYAIENVDPKVKDRCFLVDDFDIDRNWKFDFCIGKDVLEHVPEAELSDVLESIRADVLFAVIPLGENGSYRAPVNNLDKTHVVCRDETWWINKFQENDWVLKEFRLRVHGIKDSYYPEFQNAHGFFTLIKSRRNTTC